jgi:hypothetical protein
MLKNMIMLIGVLLLFCRAFVLFGQDRKDFIIQGTVLVKYTGEKEYVIIPANIGITTIGEEAFSNFSNSSFNPKIKSVVIPEGVISIGDSAFRWLNNLTNVTIPKSVTSIGNSAFESCGKLTNITISESVISIGNNAFSGCSFKYIKIPKNVNSIGKEAFINESLINITVDDNNITYSSINGVLFSKDKTILIQYPAGNNRQSYTIPKSVIRIGDSAFFICKNLMSINIPSSVNYIGDSTFFGCNFSSITIPSSVTVIENEAFILCENLTNIVIPEGVTSIGDMAFFGTGLTSIVIPASVTFIGDGAFSWHVIFASYGSNLTSITVDERNAAYSSIDGVLFNKDKTVLIQYPTNKDNKTYGIPSSVTSIKKIAFYGCKNLEKITIPANVIYIEAYAFDECRNLKTILISRNVKFDENTFPRTAEIVYF